MSRNTVVNKARTDAMDMVDYLILKIKNGEGVMPGEAHDLNALLKRYLIAKNN